MELKRINLYKLRNLAHFEFCAEVKQIVTKHTAEKLNIKTAFADFCTLLAKEEEGLEVIHQHKLTAQITELDEQRDTLFGGLAANCRSLTKHFDSNIRQNAEQLVVILDAYGNVAIESYNEETAALHKLTEELLGNYTEQLTACKLTDWVTQLKTINDNFSQVMLARNEDLSKEEPVHMRSLRRKVDKLFRLMTKRVEASALLNGEADYKDFINELNGRIEYYKEHNIHTYNEE